MGQMRMAGAVAAMLLASCGAPTGGNSGMESDADISAKVDAEHAIRDLVRDPASTEFEEEIVFRRAGVPGAVVCGKFNTNNGFGGKVGYANFVWGSDDSPLAGLHVQDDGLPGVFMTAYARGCLGLKDSPAAMPESTDTSYPAQVNVVETAPAPEAPLAKNDPSLPKVVRDAAELDEECRGGEENLTVICRKRDAAFDRAKAFNWCLGDDQTVDADARWHHCDEPNSADHSPPSP